MNARKEHDVEDASDRAAKRRKSQLMRVPLRKITFWNSNRGGMAISGYHVHEIAHGIMTNKTKLKRYGHVDIVEIPPKLLETIRKENRERCSQEPLLPLFHEDIAYVCITKTHFTHAQKLAQDGNRFLYNETDVLIKWQADDTEGADIQESGPLCQIFDCSLFDDLNAMDALGTEDNLNADIAMGEDEMQAFGRISGIMARMCACQDKDVIPNAMTLMQVSGLGGYSYDDWKGFILLRLSLGKGNAVAQILQSISFKACSGRVRVRPDDFALVATLDPRAPWAKVAMMLFQYIGNMNASRKPSAVFNICPAKVSPKLQSDIIKELVEETAVVLKVDRFIFSMLKTYELPPNGRMSDLMTARGEFLANQGRFMIRIGTELKNYAMKIAAARRTQTAEARLAIVQAQSVDGQAKAELLFREKLVNAKLYTKDTLPTLQNHVSAAQDQTVAAPSQAILSSVQQEPSSDIVFCESPETELGHAPVITEAHVYRRLGITGPGKNVLALIMPQVVMPQVDTDVKAEVEQEGIGRRGMWALVVDSHAPFEQVDTDVKAEVEDNSSGLANVSEDQPSTEPAENSDSSQPNVVGTWRIVRLRNLCLPNAVVELSQESGDVCMTVSTDDLRAVPKSSANPVIQHPSIIIGDKPLDAYDYELKSMAVAKIFAEHMLLSTHLGAHLSVAGVTVHRLSEEGKTPLVLQLRANASFKKGTLVLTPADGEVMLQDS